MDSAPLPATPITTESASRAPAARGSHIVARAVESLGEQRYLLAREGRVFLARSFQPLPTGRDLSLWLARPGRPALLESLAPGESSGLGSAQVSGRTRAAGVGQLLLQTRAGEELVRLRGGSPPNGSGRFRVIEPAEPAWVRLGVGAGTASQTQAAGASSAATGRDGLLSALLRQFLPGRQSAAQVLGGLLQANQASGSEPASAGTLASRLEALLDAELWRPEEGARGLREHLRAGGGRVGGRFLQQLLFGRGAGLGGDLPQLLAQWANEANTPGGREALARMGEALLGEELAAASRPDSAQLSLVAAEHGQLRDVWLRWGDGRGRHKRTANSVRKLAIGVDFSATGRVRADLLWSTDRLRVRLRAERPEIVERMVADRSEIEARIAQGGVEAALIIELGSALPPGQLDGSRPLLESTG